MIFSQKNRFYLNMPEKHVFFKTQTFGSFETQELYRKTVLQKRPNKSPTGSINERLGPVPTRAYPKTLGSSVTAIYTAAGARPQQSPCLTVAADSSRAYLSFDSKLSSFCLPRSIRPAGSGSDPYCAVMFERALPIFLRIFVFFVLVVFLGDLDWDQMGAGDENKTGTSEPFFWA